MNRHSSRALILCVAIACVAGCAKKSRQWRAELQQPALTETEFTMRVANAIREAIPKAKIETVGPLTLEVTVRDGNATCHLHNAWTECRNTPEARVDVVTRHVDALKAALFGGSPEHPTIDQIVPMIKGQRWLDDAASQGMEIHHEPLVADLFVVYAMDGPNQLAYLNREQFESSGLDEQALRAKAIENLAGRLPDVSRHGEGPLYMLVAGGTFEASLVLLPDVWETQETAIDGRLVVAIPSRDLILFTGEDAPEAIQLMRSTVEEAHASNNYPISKTILVRGETGWLALDDQDESDSP